MISILNTLVMVLSSFLFLWFYVKSVSPAALEQRMGQKAYKKCGLYRSVAFIFEFLVVVSYFVYFFYPIEGFGLPSKFPWEWAFSILIGIVIAIPSTLIMVKGMLDAGKEAIAPQIDQDLYQGIYTKIRHPQALGEVFLWFPIAFFLHSPFLVIYSFIFFPIFYIMSKAEEKDLLLRFGDSYKEYMQATGMFFPKRKK